MLSPRKNTSKGGKEIHKPHHHPNGVGACAPPLFLVFMVGVNGLIRPAACVMFIARTGLSGDGLPPAGSSAGQKEGAANAAPPAIC